MTTLSQDLTRIGKAMANHKAAEDYTAGDLVVPLEGVGNGGIKLAVVVGLAGAMALTASTVNNPTCPSGGSPFLYGDYS